MANKMIYTVQISREGDEWLATCLDYPEAIDYAKNLSALEKGIKDAIILAADLPEDSQIQVQMTPDKNLPNSLGQALELRQQRNHLQNEQAKLQTRTREVASLLGNDGYSIRDSATALGISPGRISQLSA
ncbi:hypothetical protein [uncultured Varibaculum sp.]|nr:hypothetical protein [uncultured Varibaculum sp.]